MTTEQINKAAARYAETVAFQIPYNGSTEFYDDKLHDAALRHFQAGANHALSHSRQEIEELKAENDKLREALGDLYHFVERMKISPVAGHVYRNAARKLIEG